MHRVAPPPGAEVVRQRSKVLEEGEANDVAVRAARQGVLMHDVDQGAACLSCKSCPGFQFHVWRKSCSECQCPREAHDLVVKGPTMSKTATIYRHNSGLSARGFAMQELMTKLARLQMTQSPLYDMDASHCKTITSQKDMDKFERIRERRLKDFQQVQLVEAGHGELSPCPTCSKCIGVDEAASKICHTNECFHVDCLTCAECRDPIVAPGFFNFTDANGRLNKLCGRCHAEKFQPRCKGCDELIMDATFTRAEGTTWHNHHFCCIKCDNDLGGSHYTNTPSNQPVCLGCFDAHFAPRCSACTEVISSSSEYLMLGSFTFHQKADCFHCSVCDEHLFDSDAQEGRGVVIDGVLLCRRHAEVTHTYAQNSKDNTVDNVVCSQLQCHNSTIEPLFVGALMYVNESSMFVYSCIMHHNNTTFTFANHGHAHCWMI
eukprot:m.208365 g.208365  ORF g.208365 m.208365 type:complete len:432 (-) comp15040_c0_seq4:890-2185(-)